MKPDQFDNVPAGKEQYREFYGELAVGARESIVKLNSMVERYGSKP